MRVVRDSDSKVERGGVEGRERREFRIGGKEWRQ